MKRMVFDVETVPDVDAGRSLHDMEGLADEDVVRTMEHLHEQKTGSRFLPLYQHRVVAISFVFDDGEKLLVDSIGDESSPEKDLLRIFFTLLGKHKPQLVSWNGSGFDLPVLHYRALFRNVDASLYWEMGDSDQAFRWNNYQSRYHQRHLDLMDVLSGYNGRNVAPLDEVSKVMGFPGKPGMHGDQVYGLWKDGEIQKIRNYCEWDVLNTWLIYLRFEGMRGRLGTREATDLDERLEKTLVASGQEHQTEFLQQLRAGAWANRQASQS